MSDYFVSQPPFERGPDPVMPGQDRVVNPGLFNPMPFPSAPGLFDPTPFPDTFSLRVDTLARNYHQRDVADRLRRSWRFNTGFSFLD